jgi:hypothetical protein
MPSPEYPESGPGLCARALGLMFRTMKKKKKINKREKKIEEEDTLFFSDENFEFIAGYTSNGVPYGINRKNTVDGDFEPNDFDPENENELIF